MILKNREVIDELNKRSEYKGTVGLYCEKTVSPLNVSVADTQINHSDWKSTHDKFYSPI